MILVGLFVGVGYGLGGSSLGGRAIPLGIATGLAITAIFTLRTKLEERGGKTATAQTIRNRGRDVSDRPDDLVRRPSTLSRPHGNWFADLCRL